MASSSASATASTASAILNSVLDNIKNLPPSSAASDASSVPSSSSSFLHPSAPRFDSDPFSSSASEFAGFANVFRRKASLHDLLGGGNSADVLLWRKKHLSLSFLGASTLIWVVFEWIGYHFISLASLILLATAVILFVWTNGSPFLSNLVRQPPQVPKLEIPEEIATTVAKSLTVEINRVLAVFQEITVGNDTKRFLRLVAVLGLLVVFGSWFNFLTLVYFVIIAAHSLPVFYEKNEESLHYLAQRIVEELKNQFKKFDSSAASRAPRAPAMAKKEE